MGGSGRDQIRAARLDSAGRLYVAGFTGNQRPPGHHQLTYQAAITGLTDIFIAVSTPLPARASDLYFSYAGRDGNDIPLGHGSRLSGNIYLTGPPFTGFFRPPAPPSKRGGGSNLVSGFVWS